MRWTHVGPPIAVVTGASSGIGEAIARRVSADGMRVVLLARRADRLQVLAREIGGVAMPVDLSSESAVATVCRRILDEVGVPDVVVNNAGSGRFVSIDETEPGEAQAQVTLPYLAAFWVTLGLLGPMLERGTGVVFQVNSPVAVVPWPGAAERVPKVEALVGTMTPEQVADAVATCLRHRANRDSHAPWRWALIAPLARVSPGAVGWLFRLTGHRRSGRG
ncbi:SDR family NAD(P)-dependent oxidoreductase [Aestuariimicrobium ganziense]|uniref:SDR family NAD(P)-dependent oxidoreductase n=1 Tax=Aestuariimicrobium ganziense TaxID=2773677 RepID=UPI0019452870|nr:SDR family NAD(P)-dependent oxidoreductase [Aestuariimicrobium ganziense]